MLPHRSETQTPLIPQSHIPLPDRPVGLYVHVPFCRKACHYCNFYFSVRHTWMELYTEALLQEVNEWQPWLTAQPVRTVYFGGGTPSWLKPPLLEKILTHLRHHTRWQPVEITLEANPEDISKENLEFWKHSGITRLSLGVQSLSDDTLHFLGRKASSHTTRQAIELIRSSGWQNWSVDVIFAVPGQTLQGMASELRYLTQEVGVPHISLYGLSIEPRTVLYKKLRRGQFEPVEDDFYVEMYLFIHKFLTENGYKHYEVSNFGMEGFFSRHNLLYWEGEPYVGLGPSAHSYRRPYRWWNKHGLRHYIEQFYQKKGYRTCKKVEGEELGPKEMIMEWFMLRLRLSREIQWAEMPISPQALERLRASIPPWAEKGWIHLTSQGFRPLPQGWLWLDTLSREITELITCL